MNAEIIAVGSELLTPARLDTNSLYITGRLNEIGIAVRAKAIVGDNRGDLASVFAQALARVELIVLTGGLGPTDDDLTREVVADVLGLPLDEHESLVEAIRRRFQLRNLRMPEINRRQAMVPRGAEVIDNPNGTAPGLWIEQAANTVVLLPGPPREMQPMIDRIARERLSARAGAARIFRRVLRITGRSESHVEEAAQPVYARWESARLPIETTILAAFGQIELHLSTRSDGIEAARALLDAAVHDLSAVLGMDLYSADDRNLEQVVGELLRARGWRIALAESCTGGLVASRLTDVPGSSDYLERGVVAYSNRAKTELLGVPADLLQEHGAVSEPVAIAMAEGIRERARVECGVGVTGIAGPGGGSAQKPVGTVVIAVALSTSPSTVRTVRFAGGREQIKFQASQTALDTVRRLLQ